MLELLIALATIVTPTTNNNGKHKGWRNRPIYDVPGSVPVVVTPGYGGTGYAPSSPTADGPVARKIVE